MAADAALVEQNGSSKNTGGWSRLGPTLLLSVRASPTDLGPDRCDVCAATPNYAFLVNVYGIAVVTTIIVFGSSLLALRKDSAIC